MLTSKDIVRKSIYYVVLITAITAFIVGLAVLNEGLLAGIATHNIQIILIAAFVLTMAIVVQYKQTNIALENAKLYKALQEKQALIDRDLQMARSVQQGLIPDQTPKISGYQFAARCLPAESVGGDFFDFVEKPESTCIVLGDVSGHGVSSALVMALTNGILNEISRKSDSPAEILAETNPHIQRCLANNINFVAAFYARLENRTKKLFYSKAGHLPALLFRKNSKKPIVLDVEGTILGVFAEAHFAEASIELTPGDKVIFYTDGLIELQNPAGEWYGEERLIELISEHKHLPANQLVDTIFTNVNKFSALQRDDQTLVVLEVE